MTSLDTLRGPMTRDSVADDVFAAWVLGPAARVPKASTRSGLQAVLFDLDGVLVDTAEFHYLAWKKLADDLGIPFNRQINHAFRGVGRMECLDKLLGPHAACFVVAEKQLLAERKNLDYMRQVASLTPDHLAIGARGLAMGLRAMNEGGVRMAVVSASKNARHVIELLGIADWFDAIIDGADVTRGKPDPQGFLLAAQRLRAQPHLCVVVEDADAGLKAARAAGMATVGVGSVGGGGAGMGGGICDLQVRAVGDLTVERLENVIGRRAESANNSSQ
ncbi:MAG TPA: beta-phosphoglucomutase [Phycisphaerae bacterium]